MSRLSGGVLQTANKYDRVVLASMFALILCGLVAINSATFNEIDTSGQSGNFEKQIVWLAAGLVGLVIVLAIPIRFFYMLSYVFYGLSILLLIALFFIGSGAGTHRWIALGSFNIQPSELAKVSVILALSRFLSDERHRPTELKTKVITALLILVPFLLIARQPDLGSAVLLWTIFLPMLYWAGLSLFSIFLILAPFLTFVASFNFYTFFLIMVAICVTFYVTRSGVKLFILNFVLNILVGILSPMFWSKLKPYQQQRILGFLGLVNDPQGSGYQIIQSKVAIGSGGLWGKGLHSGTQTHLRFLPEQHTDFIFSVIAEETGFLGVLLILGLFTILFSRCFKIAFNTKTAFESLLIIGITCSLVFQVFINIGMTAGIMPVTGLPLPFISYGGSSLISVMMMMGLILSIARRRFE